MGWDGTGMNCYGMGWDGTEKYVPWTSLEILYQPQKLFQIWLNNCRDIGFQIVNDLTSSIQFRVIKFHCHNLKISSLILL